MTKPNGDGGRSMLKALLLATTSLAFLGAQTQLALAQVGGSQEVPAAPSNPSDSPEVVVTGYRKSLGEARDIKRDSVIQKDVIIAEDIAKFPELNLAESLQRLPGVQITREAGEGRRISLRGLGPDFSRVQLNGMEVLGNVDSAQDSRGQRTRDRAFDFNIFASELFSKVEVEKTFQASQNEGGMAGTVGLFTGKPFDYGPGTKGALVAKVGTNEYTQDAQPRVAGLYSYNWENKLGFTVSAAYSQRKTTEQGHNTYNYDKEDGSTWQDLVSRGLDISHLSADQQAKFLSGDLYFPDGNRISSWDAKQRRLGLTAAVQWRPLDNLLFTLDALHGEFTTHRDELHLATRPLAGAGSVAFDTPAGSPWPAIFQTASTINSIAYDKNDYVTHLDVNGTTFGSEHRREKNTNKFNQVALTGKWDLTEAFTIDGHVGYEKSTYKTPYDDKLYMRAKGNLMADYGTDGQSASFQYPGWSTTDPANYAMDDFYYRAFNNQSELQEGVLNLRYKLVEALTLSAGVAYHRFTQGGINLFYDGNVNGTNAETQGTSVADITSVFKNDFGSWLIGDYDKAFAKYKEYHRLGPKPDGTGGAIQDIENVYHTREKTVSEYVQADWDTQVLGKRFRGNLGLRGYQTETKSVGWIQGDSYAYLGTTNVEGSYSGVLPALNTVLDLEKNLLLRFSVTQNLNRPTLDSIAAKGTAFIDDSGQITASRGNPELQPFKDTTYDLALEYYFGKVGLLSAGVFEKRIKNFISSQTLDNIPFSQTGVPYTTIPGATPDTIVKELDVPVNVPGTKTLTGLELAAQMQFSFLPAPFNNLGMLANYTSLGLDKALTGISNTGYNVTLYYDSSRWGARASLSHRSRWYSGRGDDPMSADNRGFEGSTYVDAAAFYNLTSKIQLNFDAINLTNEKDTQFWSLSHYLYNQNQSGATYMIGASYKF